MKKASDILRFEEVRYQVRKEAAVLFLLFILIIFSVLFASIQAGQLSYNLVMSFLPLSSWLVIPVSVILYFICTAMSLPKHCSTLELDEVTTYCMKYADVRHFVTRAHKVNGVIYKQDLRKIRLFIEARNPNISYIEFSLSDLIGQ